MVGQFIMLFLNVYGSLSISTTFPFNMWFFHIFMQMSLILWVPPQSLSTLKEVWSKHMLSSLKKLFFTVRKLICEGQNKLWQRRFWLDDWTFHNQKSDNHSTFDPLVKLHFLPKDTIHSFSHHMLQHYKEFANIWLDLRLIFSHNYHMRLAVVLNCLGQVT
jgi:hypothetical protein